MSPKSPNSPGGILTDGFQFTQSNLQDFQECRKRFQYRYLQKIAWPAIESEPAIEFERMVQRGTQFHRLAHQRLVGIPEEALVSAIQDPEIMVWWENFRIFLARSGLDGWSILRPEFSLTAAWGHYRLAAKYDLIASRGDGTFLIFDWKTAQHRIAREALSKRIQTRLYPCLLVLAGEGLNQGNPIDPQKVEMTYWYAAFPDQPVRFPYSDLQFEKDRVFIDRLVDEIASMPEDKFFLTSDQNRCAYCRYRSLCNRGETAGELDEMQRSTVDGNEFDFEIDLDQIAEIEF